MSIADKNALPIRPRMDVYVGLVDYAADLTVTLAFRSTGGTTQTKNWPPSAPGSYGFGYPDGMHSSGTTFYVDITESGGQTIDGVFVMADYTGTWTVGWNGADEEEIAPMMYVPMQTDSDRLYFYRSAAGSYVNKIWVIPVTSNSHVFDGNSLVNATLDLASSLNAYDPTYEVSTIEASAYIQGLDLATLANLPDKVPIVYMAGYVGDEMSFPRFFYLSDAPAYEDNLLTFAGEDASAALEAYTVPAEVFTTSLGGGLLAFYEKIKAVLSAAGVALLKADTSPPDFGGTASVRSIIKEQTGRELMANMMAFCRYAVDQTGNVLHAFYPAFVDAGRPVLRWSYYDADSPDYGPFDLYEADVGEHKIEIDRDVKMLKSDDTYGLQSTVSDMDNSATRSTIATVAVRAAKQYKQTFQNYYRDVSVTRSTTPRTYTATSAEWKAASAGNSVVSGILQDVEVDFSTLNNSNATRGRDVTVTPGIYGRFMQYIDSGSSQLGYVPDYYTPFKQSPEHGSFTWRGNPLMQPRDPFYFHHLDGTYEVYTVERIELTHESGGTVATIHYRKGVC